MQEILFEKLLRVVTSKEDLERYLASRDFLEDQEASRRIVEQLLEDDGLRSCDGQSLHAWLRQIGRRLQHWIVPVWYRTMVDQLDAERVVSRLVVDEDEEQIVINLAKAMVMCRTDRPASVREATTGCGQAGRKMQ